MKSYETVSDYFGGATQGVVCHVGGSAWWLHPEMLIRDDGSKLRLTDCIWMAPQWPGRK